MSVSVSFDGDWYSDTIKNAIEYALKSENFNHDCEIEVLIVDKEEITNINSQTRNKNCATDVLSFPMYDNIEDILEEPNGDILLGSMVICKEQAIEQAKEYGHSIEREVSFLAVHSVLHLLGYDHELGEQEEKIMFEKQEKVLCDMGITR